MIIDMPPLVSLAMYEYVMGALCFDYTTFT